jgi:hypothetical protein
MTISTGTAYYFYPFLEFGWSRLPHISGCQDKIVALYLAMRCYPGCNCGNPFLHCGLWTAWGVHKIPEPQVRGPPQTHCSFRPERPEVTKFLGSSTSSFLLNLTAAQTPEILGLHLTHNASKTHSPRITQNTVANIFARLHNLLLHIRLETNNTRIL